MPAITHWKLAEIEIALAKSDKFNFVKNIVAFNVNGWGNNLPIFHECDMLVLSKAGYLTEIEIKRSLADFKKDFTKDHMHSNSNLIKNFYYCVPSFILDKARDYFAEHGTYECSGFIPYDEDYLYFYNILPAPNVGKKKRDFRKLTPEEQLQVARFGAMRTVTLKEKIVKLEKKIEILTDNLPE